MGQYLTYRARKKALDSQKSPESIGAIYFVDIGISNGLFSRFMSVAIHVYDERLKGGGRERKVRGAVS